MFSVTRCSKKNFQVRLIPYHMVSSLRRSLSCRVPLSWCQTSPWHRWGISTSSCEPVWMRYVGCLVVWRCGLDALVEKGHWEKGLDNLVFCDYEYSQRQCVLSPPHPSSVFIKVDRNRFGHELPSGFCTFIGGWRFCRWWHCCFIDLATQTGRWLDASRCQRGRNLRWMYSYTSTFVFFVSFQLMF